MHFEGKTSYNESFKGIAVPPDPEMERIKNQYKRGLFK
jgi:hypothetical protein